MIKDDLYDQLSDEQQKQFETGQITEVQSQEEPTTSAEEEIQPYTSEELEEAIRTGKVDYRRLSPEGKAIWASVDRGLKPKLEEAARLREWKEQVEPLLQNIIMRQQQPQGQVDPFESAFLQDPDGTLRTLRQKILEKKREDPYSEEVLRLEALKDELQERRNQIQLQLLATNLVKTEALHKVKSVIPDFETKKTKLVEVAQELGFTPQEIDYFSNPLVNPAAVKFVLALNQIYDKFNAVDLKKKQVKENVKVEKAGSGFEQPSEKQWTAEDYLNMRMKHTLL